MRLQCKVTLTQSERTQLTELTRPGRSPTAKFICAGALLLSDAGEFGAPWKGGQRGAILFTIVQACRQRGINPFDYLKDVLTQIPHHTNKTVAQLTPENWLKNRQSHAARAA